MKKPILKFGNGILTITKINFKKTRSAFHREVDRWNAQYFEREEGKTRGYDARKINNRNEVLKVVDYLCDNYKKIVNGVLKVTRTHIACGISPYQGDVRSTPTIDRFIDCLKRIRYISKRETGLHAFGAGKKNIQCLWLTINPDMFCMDEFEKKLDTDSQKKSEKTAQKSNETHTIKKLTEYPYLE